MKFIKKYFPWILLLSCIILGLATGGFGYRQLRQDNRQLEKDLELVRDAKFRTIAKLQSEKQRNIFLLGEYANIKDSLQKSRVDYENLKVYHEMEIFHILAMPADSVYLLSKEWIRSKQ